MATGGLDGGAAGFMGQVGIPAAMLAAIVLTAVEFLGGLALVLGLYTRWAAIPQAFDMLVATVALALLGSGVASADRVLERRRV